MKLNELDLQEKVLADMTKAILPKKFLHLIKRIAHKDSYKKILRLQNKIMKDQKLAANLALVKAAGVYGVNPREIMKVLDKETRHS